MNDGKIVPLEFARGIASIIVVFHHFTLAFLPSLKNPVFEGGWLYTPLYMLSNGSAAVVFFFVLSGFVLTRRFYRSPSIVALSASVLKRLPRLMLPVLISILIGLAVLLHFGAYHKEAAAISTSPWLRDFGNAVFPADFTPSLGDALRQDLYTFLFADNAYYNSNLWTMVNEYYGSLIVFAILAIFYVKRFMPKMPMLVVHILLIAVLVPFQRPLVAFVVGSLIAYVMSTRAQPPRISPGRTVILLILAAIGFSTESWWSNVAASTLVLVIFLGNDAVSRAVSGRVCSFIGVLSFPLYLVHTLVILSLTSFLYIALNGYGFGEYQVLLLALLATVVCSFALSLPLVVVDHFWVRWLGVAIRRLVEFGAAVLGRDGPRNRPG